MSSGLALAVFTAARVALSLPIALVVLYVTMRLASIEPIPELTEALVFVCAVLVLRTAKPRHISSLIVAGSLLSSVAVLGKLNAGVVSVAFVVVVSAAIERSWWRGLLLATCTCLVATLALWLLAGQRIGDLPAFGTAAVETVIGYAGAMAIAPPSLATRGLAFIEIGVVSTLGFSLTREWPTRRRVAMAVVWALYAGSVFTEGFTREGPGHNMIFFTAMVLAAIAMLPRSRPALSSALLVTLVAMTVFKGNVLPGVLVDPLPSAHRFASEAVLVVRPSRWTAAAAATGRSIAAGYQFPGGLSALVAGKTVHFAPEDSALVFAIPGVRWDPEPVFQAYAAYTTGLDQMNATFLTGPRAPDAIVRRLSPLAAGNGGRATSEDRRFRWWDQPAATLAMLCRYRERMVLGNWQVLDRGPDDCGSPVTTATVTGEIGQDIRVPVSAAPDQFLVVRISALPSGVVPRIWDLLMGARPWYATVDGIAYRLVPGTVGDGLLLAAPPSVAWSPAFSFGPPVRSFAITGPAPSGTHITLQFQVIPFVRSP